MDPLLAFADELERRDAHVAVALADVERLQREVDELRARSAEAAAFLESLPAALAERAAEERAALDACARFEAALHEAEAAAERARHEGERLVAARDAERARADIEVAARQAAEAREAAQRLEGEGEARRAEARRLVERASELSGLVKDAAPPADDLAGTLEWASAARGALLVEHSVVARERDAIVREASELVGSVLGEPLALTAVAGVRGRLEDALASA